MAPVCVEMVSAWDGDGEISGMKERPEQAGLDGTKTKRNLESRRASDRESWFPKSRELQGITRVKSPLNRREWGEEKAKQIYE